MFYDVIVIGAGLAGLMAAEAAQAEGARVLILAKGMGSLPLTTGCIDILGYFPSTRQTPVSSPGATMTKLQEVHPNHPYLKVGEENISLALRHFKDLCGSAGLPFTGDINSTFLIPTALGTSHPTGLVPESMKHGHLSKPGAVLLLGFEGLKDFSPFLASENFNVLYAQGKIAPSFRAKMIPRMDLGGKALNGLNLAQAFDEEAFQDLFVREAQPLLKNGERLGIPAVLGFRSSSRAWEGLQEKLGTEIFEIPLPPPSIPGMRLYNLLKVHFKGNGGRLLLGLSNLEPILGSEQIQGFSLGVSKKSPVYHASAVILATGKFVGGGLDSNRSRVYETLLGLPVKHPPHRREWFTPHLLSPQGQPFNAFGVEVDKNLRPVDRNGQVLYSNLFAAGGIIAHADSMSEKSGGGVAIATGYRAGKLAAEYASSVD